VAGLPNGASPAADRGVPESSWHEAAGLESNPAHAAHGLCQAPGVPSGMGNVEQIEQRVGAHARYVGGQSTFEHPFPGVRTLLGLLSALIHSFDARHGCDRGLSTDLHLPQISYEGFDFNLVKSGGWVEFFLSGCVDRTRTPANDRARVNRSPMSAMEC
jgi:hypothetical protein